VAVVSKLPDTKTPDTLALAHELRETLGRVIRRLRSEHGPPVALLSVLGRLDREGPAGISDLAAAERMRPQSMAQIVRELQTSGLVERRPDPSDGRRWFVELTPAGRARLQATRMAREDWLSETLEQRLDGDERELLHEAIALLSRIAET
jgi:DNA-binding MarR family transcriptional regulator